MHLRKETWRDRRWRWASEAGPFGWLWRCYVCNLEATYPTATLHGGYADALEHLENEHLTGTDTVEPGVSSPDESR
jgi:hypothetical protein